MPTAVTVQRRRLGQVEPEVAPGFSLTKDPLALIENANTALTEIRDTVKESRIQLTGISPVLKNSVIVLAASASLLTLLYLIDFLGLNPFRE